MNKQKSIKIKLGQFLVKKGLVSLRDINRCTLLQKKLRGNGKGQLLGQILLKEDLISHDSLRKALAGIGALNLYCPRCGWTGKAVSFEPGKVENCPECQAIVIYQDGTSDKVTKPGEKTSSKPVHCTEDTTVTSDPAKDSFINRIIGGCQVLERIARGGMGVVYKAKQLNLGRTVALKILSEDLAKDSNFVKRFVNEAQAAAELNHGNLIHINDVGETDGIFYFSMEFVEGPTLAEILRKKGTIDILWVAEVTMQVCQALRHAHGKNIIHRDIKPDNIMITGDGIVKLADLGLAKRKKKTDCDLTQPGAIMGTPYYMAPEQAKDFSRVDERSDIYSLGVTIYRLLTGRVPFNGKSPLEVMMKACAGKKTSICELRPEVPKDFELFVERMMDVDKEKRYQNINEVIKDLEKVIQIIKVQSMENA